MIEETLRSLCQKSAIVRVIDHVQDDKDVSGILEDLQETIHDYQVCSRSRRLLDIDADTRWYNKWRFMIKDAN